MYKDLWERLPEVERGLCSPGDLLLKQPPEGLRVRPAAAEHRLALYSAFVPQAQQLNIWDLP